MSGHPTDVGGAPINVVVFQIENPFARRETFGEIAAGGVDDSFRFAGGARGVERVEHLLGIDECRLACRLAGPHEIVVPVTYSAFPRERFVRLIFGPASTAAR